MKTNVYVDGYNLYYGAVKGTPYRWLDLGTLCQVALPKNQINRLRYFTARVASRPADPLQPRRQQVYLRALRTIPNLEFHFGHFLRNVVRMPMVRPPAGGPDTIEVWKTEEKGSDVNLASYLLLDCFDRDCEAAAIISNDSDLAEPIRLARKRFGIKVVVLHPACAPLASGKRQRVSIELKKAASKSILITEDMLKQSQFASPLIDQVGSFTKPATW